MDRSDFETPYYALLESSLGGRYTIEARNPSKVLVADGRRPFLDILDEEIRKTPPVDSDLPFCGGWIGYLGYELYSEIEPSVPERQPDLIPRAVMAYYDQFTVYDHQAGQESASASPNASHPSSSFPNSSAESYKSRVREIKRLIAAGDCYQVNLAERFSMPFDGAAFDLYQSLRRASPSPYAAYLNLGDAQILSSSPESFLSVDGRRVITRPIKGTRPRGRTPAEDAAFKEELTASEKDRAELLMITDLERNDLGRVCLPGSVRVSRLGDIETYPQVHHRVATVEGDLKENCGVIDLLRAAFPGGSITGAPKIRAMQIIRELEPRPRNVYCGAIGYVSANGKAQFNIAIRTLILKDKTATFWGGSGIVADSDPERECEETLTKVKGIVEALA